MKMRDTMQVAMSQHTTSWPRRTTLTTNNRLLCQRWSTGEKGTLQNTSHSPNQSTNQQNYTTIKTTQPTQQHSTIQQCNNSTTQRNHDQHNPPWTLVGHSQTPDQCRRRREGPPAVQLVLPRGMCEVLEAFYSQSCGECTTVKVTRVAKQTRILTPHGNASCTLQHDTTAVEEVRGERGDTPVVIFRLRMLWTNNNHHARQGSCILLK